MKKINKFFEKSKILSADKFIHNVLYDKLYGYYSTKNPLGKNGDFITAPAISFLFGEMIAIWMINFWEKLKEPKYFNIVELGPGDGKLCNTLLNTFNKFPKFSKHVEIYLYEKSEKLIKVQKKILFQRM